MSDAPDVFKSAREQVEDVSSGAIDAADLLEVSIQRYEVVNPAINAVVRTDFAAARARARDLDRLARSGRLAGPLHGLPITVKDTFDVDGMPATAGAPEYARRPPRVADAAAIVRLKAAGAIVWGKTNTPYLAGDNQTSNPVHGLTRNPWDLNRTPGGSSGGAAAALATGVTALEIGSDIGGSLRFPAHFCGVAALKPSYGRVPIRGHVPPAPGSISVRDLNVAGPMARNVADLGLLFSILAGIAPTIHRTTDLRGKRIGVWWEEPGFPVSVQCRTAVEAACQGARELGAHVARAKPDFEGSALLDLYLRLLLPILASDMPPPLVKAMEVGRPLARALAKREPYSRSKWALYSAATHHDWLKANEARERLKQEVAAFFTRWHALITPVAPSTAFEHIQAGDSITRKLSVDGTPAPYHTFHSWIALATVCHLPSVVIPLPQARGDLPCGVQIIGPEGGDIDVLEIAEALEAEVGGFTQPPELDIGRQPPASIGVTAKPARPRRSKSHPELGRAKTKIPGQVLAKQKPAKNPPPR
ncbi:MAG: amidase family protein [Alphaproteobacteria bacterium]|nr:amidase family protein [Alphaproteobacteria bacterium]